VHEYDPNNFYQAFNNAASHARPDQIIQVLTTTRGWDFKVLDSDQPDTYPAMHPNNTSAASTPVEITATQPAEHFDYFNGGVEEIVAERPAQTAVYSREAPTANPEETEEEEAPAEEPAAAAGGE
jgi:hypothetical protein